jgi:hypothetical protein
MGKLHRENSIWPSKPSLKKIIIATGIIDMFLSENNMSFCSEIEESLISIHFLCPEHCRLPISLNYIFRSSEQTQKSYCSMLE